MIVTIISASKELITSKSFCDHIFNLRIGACIRTACIDFYTFSLDIWILILTTSLTGKRPDHVTWLKRVGPSHPSYGFGVSYWYQAQTNFLHQTAVIFLISRSPRTLPPQSWFQNFHCSAVQQKIMSSGRTWQLEWRPFSGAHLRWRWFTCLLQVRSLHLTASMTSQFPAEQSHGIGSCGFHRTQGHLLWKTLSSRTILSTLEFRHLISRTVLYKWHQCVNCFA